METITVSVEREDIENGSRLICSLCPVAQAMRRAVGLAAATGKTASRFDAMAQPSRLYARGPTATIMCDAPKEVRDRIVRWDGTGEMEPFSFSVPRLPPDVAAPWEFMISNMRRF